MDNPEGQVTYPDIQDGRATYRLWYASPVSYTHLDVYKRQPLVSVLLRKTAFPDDEAVWLLPETRMDPDMHPDVPVKNWHTDFLVLPMLSDIPLPFPDHGKHLCHRDITDVYKRQILSSLPLNVGSFEALFQGAVDCHCMVGEHLVAVKPSGEAAAGGDGQAGHADSPGKFFLRNGVCFRITGIFLILREPVVGQPGQVLGCKLSHGLVQGFTVGQQLLGGTAGAGPGGLALVIDLKGKKHILSAPLDLTLKDIMAVSYTHLDVYKRQLFEPSQ